MGEVNKLVRHALSLSLKDVIPVDVLTASCNFDFNKISLPHLQQVIRWWEAGNNLAVLLQTWSHEFYESYIATKKTPAFIMSMEVLFAALATEFLLYGNPFTTEWENVPKTYDDLVAWVTNETENGHRYKGWTLPVEAT